MQLHRMRYSTRDSYAYAYPIRISRPWVIQDGALTASASALQGVLGEFDYDESGSLDLLEFTAMMARLLGYRYHAEPAISLGTPRERRSV